MKRIFVLLFLFLAIGGKEQTLLVSGNRYQFSAAGKDQLIEFCSLTMFRVRSSWNGSFEAPEPWMVVRYQWNPVAVKRRETTTAYQLSTEALMVNITKQTLTVEVLDKTGKVLSSETISGGGTSKRGEVVHCAKRLAQTLFEQPNSNNRQALSIAITK